MNRVPMAEVEVVRVSSKGQIVIPKGVRSRLGLKKGDKLLAYSKGDMLLIRKVGKEESLLAILSASSRRKITLLKISRMEVEKVIEEARKTTEEA
ncbi:MAG: AbrB/MazE/SpoVT family DNA-binding domain-containing protein [Thermoproteota archaeon]|nr:AbrB/MazE/SpoVT family DNA-binding domain-containing protein [Candidatus Brockarchaeota archaeon]